LLCRKPDNGTAKCLPLPASGERETAASQVFDRA
jgi:hypothetical protein